MSGRVLARRRGLEFVSTGRREALTGAAFAALLAGIAWHGWAFDRDPWWLSTFGLFALLCAVGAAVTWDRPERLVLDVPARALRLGDGGLAAFDEVASVSVETVAEDGGTFGRDSAALLRLKGGRSFLLAEGPLGLCTPARARALAAELSAATGAPLVDGEPEKI